MRAVRYGYILALAVWLGGMIVVAGVVAPAIFSAIEAPDPAAGRALAGRIFGRVLARFNIVAYAAGATMLLALGLQRAVGPRPRAFGLRAGLVAGMLAVTLYSGVFVSPRIDALQREAGGAISHLTGEDPRRLEFDGLHQLSSRLFGVVALGGLLLLAWETRE
jgi:hypothetical protein